MALTRGQTEEVAIPHEPGHWLRLRKLSWTQLDEARRAKGRKVLRNMANDPEAVKLLAEVQAINADKPAATTPAEALTVPADPLDEYDQQTLLEFGVVGWSYDEDVTPESIADLDEVTAEWAARQVLPKPKTPEERLDFTSLSPAL